MDRFEAMTILLAAVDAGSLSAASRQLRIPLATVSRRMSELEEHLKIRLLLRGHRKLTLTDAGRTYVASCRRIMEDIAEVERTAAGEYLAPQGELIISVPIGVLGRTYVMPIVVEFLRTYPDIRMRVQSTDRVVNLLDEHIDLALRVGELPDSSLIATRVGVIRPVLCASPDYLKDRPAPKTPADLASHDCVAYEGYAAGNNWEFSIRESSQMVQVSSRLIVSSAEAAVVAATAGAGIARVFSHQIGDLVRAGSLVMLLEAYEPASTPVSLIYPSQRQVPLKLRAFLDFLLPRLRARLGS
jgi:DNA-binding transcriptional LysR family regulator